MQAAGTYPITKPVLTMANNTNTRSILKEDPAFEGLDFATLRTEGINYVAELSGKIWTDHNVHDPGITLLELLCYALMDLGYRTRLPAIDLFSRNPGSTGADDNFFTPGEVLTCNPVTIMDFRKLLIDIKEVKNAWLEVNDEWLGCNAVTLPEQALIALPGGDPGCKTFLNGLYKVYIELYKGPYAPESSWTRKEKEQVEAVVDKVRGVLMAHRNLCEDFASITVLCREKIGVCADIDLEPSADAEKVYLKIVETLKAFFSPDPTYYTLQQLIDKGKPIEDIFAGRPFLPESHGFTDTAELEGIRLRKEIHVSDVYNALFAVPGIRTIRKLRLRGCGDTKQAFTPGECDWKYHLTENHAAEFSADCSGFRFTRNGMPVTVNENKYKDFFALGYSLSGKVLYKDRYKALDFAVPKGFYYQDLGRYDSIQNELPRVYGISEGGLPDTASPLRKAQALQLKGYLLFFDQLLANYLSQLSQLRKLFAFRNGEQQEEHTYFTAMPQQVPDIGKLLRFGAESGSAGHESIPVLPVAKTEIENWLDQHPLIDADIHASIDTIKFVTAADRDAALHSLTDDLQNGTFTLHTPGHNSKGWFFYILPFSGQTVLLGRQYYCTEKEAKFAAERVVYSGAFRENYRTYTDSYSGLSGFSPELNNAGYAAYLQQLAENKELYLDRRKDFLDHLLARFAESFTDFALLSYGSVQEQELKQQEITRKNNFLSSYDRLGRDRGKAYDYKKNGWDNKNISGFEQRVKALAGIDGCCGQSVCHFEVMEYTGQYYWSVTAAGKTIFKSNALFDTQEETAADLGDFLKAMNEKEAYQSSGVPLHDTHSLSIRYKKEEIVYPVFQSTKEKAETVGEQLRGVLAGYAGPADIFVSKEVYRLLLFNHRDEQLRRTLQSFETARQALSAAKASLKKINAEEWESITGEEKPALDLRAGKADPFRLVDITPFTKQVTTCADEYRWVLHNTAGAAVLHSSATYASAEAALESLPEELTGFTIGRDQFRLSDTGYRFDLLRPDGTLLASSPELSDEEARGAAIDFVIDFAKREKEDIQYTHLITEACHWQVRFGNGMIFRSLALLADPENAMNTWRKDKRAFRNPENYSWDWDENGQQRLSVKDDNNKIIARLLAQSWPDAKAEDVFTIIEKAFTDKSFQTEPVKAEAGYGFRLGDNSQVLLSGYEVYSSRGIAFLQMLRALEKSRQESLYLKSGDEGNREFTFLLKNDESQFLAEHPAIYDTEKERDDMLHRATGLLKDMHTPAGASKDPVKYTYSIASGDRLLLSSVQKFAATREAAETANQALIHAGDASAFRLRQDQQLSGYKVVLMAGEQELAAAPGIFTEEAVAEGVSKDIISTVSPHLYSVQAVPFPDKWRFNFHLGIEPWSAHFQSTDEYSSAEEAVSAHRKMAADLQGLKIQHAEGSTRIVSKQKINKTSISAILQPADEPDKEATADTSLAISQTLHQLAAAEDKKALLRTVKKDPLAEQGTWVYRLRKKDEFFAWHPGCGSDQADPHRQIKDLHDAVTHRPDYLQICAGGDIVYKKKNPATGEWLYHFIIKARNIFYTADPSKELALFISTKGYLSAEEAEKAFEASYLLVLKRASMTVHYGPGKFISLEEPAAGDTGDCAPKKISVVYIPAETLEKQYGNDTTAAVAGLTTLAKSYPVRISGKNGYKFSLYDYKKDKSFFISAACYDTPAAAIKAFFFLLVLARNRKNYYLHCDPDTGNKFIVIREVLVESNRRFITKDEAWGSEGVDKLIGTAQSEKAFYLFTRPDDCCYSFFIACRSKIIHPCTYDTARARDQALMKLYKKFAGYQLPELPVVSPGAGDKEYEVIYQGKRLAQFGKRYKDKKQGLCMDEFFDLLERALQPVKCNAAKDNQRLELKDTDDNIIAWLDSPGFNQQEWIVALAEMAARFPVFRKDSLYYFRLPYPDAETDISISDPCGCDEKLPADPPGCAFAWEGGCYASCTEAFEALQALPEKLKDEANFHAVFDCSCGSYRIAFVEPAEIIAINPQCYSSAEMACDAVERTKRLINCEGMHLVEHILLRPRGCPDHCGCLVPACPDEKCRFTWKEQEEKDPCKPAGSDACFIPGQDPYSCIATVILPAWPIRFRTQANRDLVARLLYREAPSHISLRILWLSPKDFCTVETTYRSWTRWMGNKKDRCGKIFDLCSFIDLLFNTRLDCWWPQAVCTSCDSETTRQSPCAELNSQENRSETCDLTIGDIYCWSTPDCCYEHPRLLLTTGQEAEKIKLIRKRTSRFRDLLLNLAAQWPDDKITGQAMSYLQGNAASEMQLLQIIRGAALVSGDDPEKAAAYKSLSAVLLGFYLDRKLLDQYDPTALSDIKRTIQSVEKSRPEVLKEWNMEELNDFMHEKTSQALRGILRTR